MDKEKLAEIVMSAKKGNQKALEDIFGICHDMVYFLALKTVRNHEDALDIVQETYTAVFQSIRKLENVKAFNGWLCQITINKCKRFWEKKKELLLSPDEEQRFEETADTDEEFIPQSALDKAETRKMIMSLIDILPNEQRITVMLFYFEDLKVEEIALVMECPANTVKSRLPYARKQIREGIERYGRKGEKLYGITSVPVLSLLLKDAAKENAIPDEVSAQIFEKALRASEMISSTTIYNTGGILSKLMNYGIVDKIINLPVTTKVIAGALLTVLTVTGITVPVLINENTDDKGNIPIYSSTVPDISVQTLEQSPEEIAADAQIQQTSPENVQPLSFKDKELERYVRHILNKKDGEIFPSELDKIEEIFIYGKSFTKLKGTIEYESESPGIENNTQYIDENGVKYIGKGAVTVLDDLQLCKNLKRIRICYNEISDITPLCGLKQLTDLDLRGNSINPEVDLSALNELKQFSLAGNQIADISGIRLPSGLKSLILKNNNIVDLSVLRELTGLEAVNFESNSISDIAPLEAMTRMKVLLLQGNNIRDISALAGMKDLESVILFNNEISDISSLEGKSKLRELFIFYNKITDISPLNGLTSLEILWILDNRIENLTPLRGIKSLKELHMQRNRISDIKPLKELTQLEVLELSENSLIRDISPLENLTNLKDLKLAYNKIKNIDALADMKKLEILWLNSNLISDIGPLSNLTNLKELYLITNYIEDVSPLKSLTGLRDLRIGFNSITDFSPLSDLKNTKIERDRF